jgi:U4/U6 small nuclear ribonucleoprotein PRP31
MLRYSDVRQVSDYIRGKELSSTLQQLEEYESDVNAGRNALVPTDPEYRFVTSCGSICCTIEAEKAKIACFIRDHYARRFPELPILVPDGMTLAKAVQLLGNNIDSLEPHVDALAELLPSQLLVALIAAAATTMGEPLADAALAAVTVACEDLLALEEAKQVLLEYSQSRMILICRNLCAFLGTGITSQLVGLAGGVRELMQMELDELMRFGSARGAEIGVGVRTAGFLINADLVASQPPELRSRALRLVTARVLTLASVDFNRPAADESEGVRARSDVIRIMLQWTDPLFQSGPGGRPRSNRLYERPTRGLAARREREQRDMENRRAMRRQHMPPGQAPL